MNIPENPKFLHVANHRHENLFQAPIMIGGFYNWHMAMNGEFSLYKAKEGRLKNYDIIFLGLSKPELDGVVCSRVRKEIGPKSSETKLVVCIDYSIELWQNIWNPYQLEAELSKADMIFISEPTMVSNIKSLLDSANVHHIVHPSRIDLIKRIRKPLDQRSNEIVTIIHRYDNNWLSPFLATKELPWPVHAVCLDGQLQKHIYAFFKFIRGGFEFAEFLDWVSRKKVILDSYHKIHNYGRNAVDNACLAIPTVGSNWTWAQKFLWPDLTVEPGDVYTQKQLLRKLMEDKKFYRECVKKADEKLDFFSYENRKKELLEKLYGDTKWHSQQNKSQNLEKASPPKVSKSKRVSKMKKPANKNT